MLPHVHASGFAPDLQLSFQSVFPEEDELGRSLGGIHAIAQDHHGFMWFGGESALARYDGRHTRLYEAKPEEANGLIHGFIRRLEFDATGVLWIATERGLCRYNEIYDDFDCHLKFVDGGTLPNISIQALAVDHANRLYVGAGDGVYSISPDRQTLTKIQLTLHNTNQVFNGVVADLAIDRNGLLWVGSANDGLFAYSPETQSTNHYWFDANTEIVNPLNISHNKIKCLLLDHRNRLWIGSFGGGLSVLNAERTDFNHFHQAEFARRGLASNVIWDIFEDSKRNLWVAVDQSGLVYFDEANRRFISHRYRSYDRSSIHSNQLRTVYEDKNGDLWIGAFPYGVAFHNRATRNIQNFRFEPDNPNSLSHSAVLSLMVDDSKNMWVGTEDGLNRFDRNSGQFKRFQARQNIGLETKAVLSLAPRDKNSLWVGTWSAGLSVFDVQTESFIPFNRKNNPILSAQFVWDILISRQGQTVVGSEFNGLNIYDPANYSVRYIRNVPGSPEQLPSNFVWDVLQDRFGQYWLAVQGGLVQLDEHFEILNRYTMSDQKNGLHSDLLVSLYEDKLGDIWVGSMDNGAAVLDREQKTFRHISVDHGLPSKAVSGFIEDAQNNLWFSTSNGLAMLNRQTNLIRVLKKEDGLAGNNFNRRASFLDENGFLYFGGTDGLSRFDPLKVFEDEPDFKVLITDFRISNRSAQIGPDKPLKKSIVMSKVIHLDYTQRVFSIDFAALNYRRMDNNRYTYKLEGFDQGWNQARDYPTATYTNLSAGKYIFKVRASRKNLWVESEPLTIIVQQPPWFSAWAILIYVLTALMLGLFVAKYWHLKLRAKIYKSLSVNDSLTGLKNRMGLMQDIEARLSSSLLKQNLCIIFLDVDHFKRINDQRGHQAGDSVLKEMAGILMKSVRQSDALGRWGGEEFMLVCSNLSIQDAVHLAEKLRENLAHHVFFTRQSPLKVTASFGVAQMAETETFQSAFNRADAALYQAKGEGRNCVVLAEE